MGLLDALTGGKSGSAIDALKRAEAYFGAVNTPTAGQLTLPELQKYIEAGIITPAEAQAYLQERNAFADQDIDQTGTAAMVQALNQLSDVASAGPEGTPMQQAQMENTISKMNQSIGGQRGAIENAMAARGTPYALIQAALANQTVGQEGQQAHLDAVNAQAAAYQTALDAMARGGELGGQLQGQQNQQANTIAQAQNAMQQFNAMNQQNAAQANANRAQDANFANLQNKQNVANANTGVSNYRTEYNAKIPQQVFNNQMQKAMGQAGAATNIGQMYQQQGQQNAGIISGLIGAGAGFIGGPGAAKMAAQPPSGYNPNISYDQLPQPRYAAHGGILKRDKPNTVGAPRGYYESICMDDGGIVPGEADVSGDSLMNDQIPVTASPGEAVIPRSSVAENPEVVASLLGDANAGPQIDFQDVATLLKALRGIRMGVC